MVQHIPVLLNEALEYLNCREDLIYVDCTLGAGGHTSAILNKLNFPGRLVSIDSDETALSHSIHLRKSYPDTWIPVLDNFKNLKQVLETVKINKITGGILADLGLSLDQLKDSSKGLSFKIDAPLDMRLDKRLSVTAYEIVNTAPQPVLEKILKEYGEEHQYKKIVNALMLYRRRKPIASTCELRDIIMKATGKTGYSKIDPATKTFMSLRIAVNNELENLECLLKDALDVLDIGAKIVIITFHSLEDRLVKRFFINYSKECTCLPHYPQCVCGQVKKLKILTKKPVTPGLIELRQNNAARSAKLRAAEKVA